MQDYRVGRRQFLAGVAGTALAPWLSASAAAQVPTAPRNLHLLGAGDGDPGGIVLGRSDFTFLGSYIVETNSWDSVYGQGLTHRYVNGQLRLLVFDWVGGAPRLTEFTPDEAGFNGTIGTPTNQWYNVWGSSYPFSLQGKYVGLWWDQAANRLWTVDTVDYNGTLRQVQIFTRTLNSDGTVSNVHGPIGLSGIPDKRAFGGVQAVPSWFRSQYGVGPYAVGWGGYTSLLALGGGASLGPTMYLIPDPQQFPNGVEIPVGQFKTGMDCISGTRTSDWYRGTGASRPSTFDRGVRVSPVANWFDGNDNRNNPTTAPIGSPTDGNWLSPAPDGLGRWAWGDGYYNTGCWIDGPRKRGFLALATVGAGVCWYGGSTLNYERRAFEFHVYDPVRIGESVQGGRAVWDVKPTSLWAEQFEGLGTRGLWGGGTSGAVAGATYDPIASKLYVLGYQGGGEKANRLYVYHVDA